MTKSFVCLTQYLRNHTSYDCEFWCTCVNQFVLLYISGTVDHIIEILIMISTGVFLYFFLKMQHCKYWNYFVFYWPTSTVFLIIICFSSSSVNAKKKFWGVIHLLHVCVIFCFLCVFLFLACLAQDVWQNNLFQFAVNIVAFPALFAEPACFFLILWNPTMDTVKQSWLFSIFII